VQTVHSTFLLLVLVLVLVLVGCILLGLVDSDCWINRPV